MALFFNWSRKGAGMRRSTLRELFNMDAARLSDLGITRYDIAEAVRSGNAGEFLAARRSARASSWMR